MTTGIPPPPVPSSPQDAGGGAEAGRARAILDGLAVPFVAVAGFLGVPLFVVVGAVIFGGLGVLLSGVLGAGAFALLTWPALVALLIAAGIVRLVHARRGDDTERPRR
jgi:hypothetical protein